MAKSVEVNELKEWIWNWFEKNRYWHPYSKTNNIPIPELYDILESMPTVDAVEVVRCKDCKYGEPNGQYGCKCYHYKLYETHEMSPNDFCSHGERREDANN